MRQQIVHQLLIVAAVGMVFFTNLGGPGLWDEDEPLYASCAREMIERGDWVVPYYNGQMFAEKPPLVYWEIISGFKLFGIGELGARFWSAVLAVGTALIVYHLGRILLTARIGLWAGLAVGSSLLFAVSARAATVDSALVFFTMLAVLIFCLAGIAKRERIDKRSDSGGSLATDIPFLPDSWISFAMFYACLGVAVLAKGPIGFLLPMAAIGLFLMIMNRRQEKESRPETVPEPGRTAWLVALWRLWRPANFFRSLWQMRPLTGAVIVIAIALPWYVLVGLRSDGVWLEEFAKVANWDALTSSRQGHGGPLWYYLPATMIGFFPWSVLLMPAVVDMVRRIRNRDPLRDVYVLAACWLGVYFVFWSICGTKLPHYVLPTYPVLALLVGSLVEQMVSQPAPVDRRRLITALSIIIVAGMGIMIAIPIVTTILAPGEQFLGLVGLVLVGGGGLSVYHFRRDRRLQMATALAVTSVLFVTSMFGFAALRIDRHQFSKPLMTEVNDNATGQVQFAGFRFIRESLVFYAGRPIEPLGTPDDLKRFIDSSPSPYVITLDEHQPVIEEHFPGKFAVVARRPRFLHDGEVLVLAPRAGLDVQHTAQTPPTSAKR